MSVGRSSFRGMPDGIAIAARTAVQAAIEYELRCGRRPVSVERGDVSCSDAVRAVFTDLGLEPRGRLSTDIVSRGGGEMRIIEVKGRGGYGPIKIIERELSTLRAAGRYGWLYAAWNTTQPAPLELWIIQDPARLPWAETQPAARSADQARGTRHEAVYEIDYSVVGTHGTRVTGPESPTA